MTLRVQSTRFDKSLDRPSNRVVGEIYVNYADQQIGVVGANGNVDLLPVRNFSISAHYTPKEIVFYDGDLYACVVKHSGVWADNNWRKITVAAIPGTAAFSPTQIYKPDDLVTHVGNIWRAPAIIAPGPWDETKWVKITSYALPIATDAVLGGVKFPQSGQHEFVTGVDASGAIEYDRPVVDDIGDLGSGVPDGLRENVNQANGLVVLDASGKLPAVDGSQITQINATQYFDTVSDLRAATVVTKPSVVLGYYTKGDGGGGIFYPADPSLPVDNGVVFSSATAQRWRRQYDTDISVRWFGAKGDGVADDTNALQSAIDFVGSIGGGTVHFPKGRYRVRSPVSITRPNITLSGENNRSTDIFTDQPAIPVLTISGIDTALIRDLRVSRSVRALPTHSARGIEILNASNITVQNVSSDNHGRGFYVNDTGNSQFHNCRATHDNGTAAASDDPCGWFIDSSNGKGNASTILNQCVAIFLNCVAKSIGAYVWGQSVQDTFLDAFESATADVGLWIESTNSQKNFDIHITRNIHDSYKKEGIVLINVAGATINGVWLNPDVVNAPTNSLRIENCRNVTVNSAQLFGGGNYANASGIYFKNSMSCSLNGSTIQNNRNPIVLENSGVVAISGNAVSNVIAAQKARAQLIMIRGYRNTVSCNTFDGYADYAIYLDNVSDNNSVISNSINPPGYGVVIGNDGGPTNLIVDANNRAGLSRAWGHFAVGPTPSFTVVVSSKYYVAAVNRLSAGVYQVVFEQPFNPAYCAFATAVAATAQTDVNTQCVNYTSSGFEIYHFERGVLTDCSNMNFIVFSIG